MAAKILYEVRHLQILSSLVQVDDFVEALLGPVEISFGWRSAVICDPCKDHFECFDLSKRCNNDVNRFMAPSPIAKKGRKESRIGDQE